MATAASSAANSTSPIHRYSIDSSSVSRSRHGSSPWFSSSSEAIVGDLTPSISFPSAVNPSVSPPAGKDTSDDNDNADKKPVWNKLSSNSVEVASSVMGAADAWPALSLSAKASSNKHTSLESDGSSSSSSPMPPPQARVAPPLSSSSNANPSENHAVNGQKKPFKRNNTASSSSGDQNHIQRGGGGGSYGSGSNQFRNSNRNRNGGSDPRWDHGNRRNYERGNQGGFLHRNFNGRDMQLQPQRGAGMMRPPPMMMGPPSFPASSAQHMAAAPQIGSYGGPMLYPDYAPHMFLPHPPPESMALAGHFPPMPMYYPAFDAVLFRKILTQVEYYFSADNLSRDAHLKHHMNNEGWVPVAVIAGFRKLAELTDNIQTIVEALRNSQVVEVKGETIRRRGDWDKYLLPPAAAAAAAAAASNNASLQPQLENMAI